MKKQPARPKHVPAPKLSGIAPGTREMVHQRTLELAAIAGREPQQVRQGDYEQAKREVTGEIEGERQQAVLDTPPPVDPGPGVTAQQVEETPLEDEDTEGRSVTEQVFADGVRLADNDTVRQSARENQT